jgi:hypothetical protein
MFTRDEIDNLPDDNDEAFGVAEGLCRKKAFDGRNHISGSHQDKLLYITLVREVARELGIKLPQSPAESNLLRLESDSTDYAYALSRFAEAQKAASALRNRYRRHENSVLIAPATRERIKNHITSLRDMIDASKLPDWQKSKLNQRLDDLVAELDQRRASFMRTMIILAAVAGSLGSAVGGVAEAPQALQHIGRIVALLGHDKKAEDDERERLTSPPKALPSPPENPTQEI